MVEDYSLYSYRENYAKLNLNNAEESFIVYMIIRTQILGNYSNNTDYKVIFNDIGKPKGKKRKKGSPTSDARGLPPQSPPRSRG